MSATDSPAALRHTTLALRGTHFHVAEAGHGDLAILLHGFPECWYSWRHVMQALAPHFRVMAPDGRGFNLSQGSANLADYTFDALCDDLLALLRHAGAERCVLVGHDWGGVLAWHFAARHAACVSRLVILNAPHPNRFQWALDHDPAQRLASQYITRLREAGCEERLGVDGLWNMTLGGHERKGLLDATEKALYVQGWRQAGALSSMLNWYRAAPFVVPAPDDADGPDHQHLIGDTHVSAPTLLIWGMRDDILLPVLLDGLDEHVPHLEICRVDDAGHGLLHEQPLLVAGLVRDYLLRGAA